MSKKSAHEGIMNSIINCLAETDRLTSVQIAAKLDVETKRITSLMTQLRYQGRVYVVDEFKTERGKYIPVYSVKKKELAMPDSPCTWFSSLIAA